MCFAFVTFSLMQKKTQQQSLYNFCSNHKQKTIKATFWMTLVAYNIFFYYIFVHADIKCCFEPTSNESPQNFIQMDAPLLHGVFIQINFCQMNKSNPSLLLNALYTFYCSENKKNFKIPFPPSHFSSPLNQVNSTQ